MPAVLVHGVPDTSRLWRAVVERLARDDIVVPDLPGFGAPLPDGFDATKEEYLEWLIALLEGAGEPVDLVGHDWGSLLVQRVVTVRPDLVRTLTFGGAALDPGYSWHAGAVAWQTPDVGEAVMDAMTPDAVEPFLVSAGYPPDEAAAAAARVDSTMKDCILRLYRSAVDVSSEWGDDVGPTAVRSLALWGADDEFVPPAHGRAVASRLGGDIVVLEGCGHWWPVQEPDATAAALERLWS